MLHPCLLIDITQRIFHKTKTGGPKTAARQSLHDVASFIQSLPGLQTRAASQEIAWILWPVKENVLHDFL
jgi:hypothetical protein